MYNDFKEYMCDINLNAKTDLENVNEVFQLGKRRDKHILKETITVFMLTSSMTLYFYLLPLHFLQIALKMII